MESADCRLWKGALILLCSCSPMGGNKQTVFSVAGELCLDSAHELSEKRLWGENTSSFV